MNLAALYSTPADTVEVGDYVRIEETYEGTVLAVEEDGDDILITIADADEYDDKTTVTVQWDTLVEVMAADYSEVEEV